MTLESSLPYVSGLCALAAAAATGAERTGLERWLKGLAFAALAVFAYFRWISPTELAIALTFGAIGQALLPRRAGFVAMAASWLVLADLFLQSGDGLRAITTDAVRGGIFVALFVAAAFAVRPRLRGGRTRTLAVLALAAALVLMGVAALTLDWGFWPAIAGAAAVLAGQGAESALAGAGGRRRALIRRAAWIVAAAGQAAVAYAFLK